MEENQLSYPLGVLIKEDTQWVLHVGDSENYYLHLELLTRVCTFRDHVGDTVLNLGFFTQEKFIELCERNCSGRLLQGVDFFGQLTKP